MYVTWSLVHFAWTLNGPCIFHKLACAPHRPTFRNKKVIATTAIEQTAGITSPQPPKPTQALFTVFSIPFLFQKKVCTQKWFLTNPQIADCSSTKSCIICFFYFLTLIGHRGKTFSLALLLTDDEYANPLVFWYSLPREPRPLWTQPLWMRFSQMRPCCSVTRRSYRRWKRGLKR